MAYQRPLRFTARRLEYIDHGPHCWKTQRMGVFDGDHQIGEYEYGYSSDVPFYAFEQHGQWYALVSMRDYTATKVLKLPECTVLGGEQGRPDGFCPVEFYVPAFYRIPYEQTHEAGHKLEVPRQTWLRIYDDRDFNGDKSKPPTKKWIYEQFGFRSGCVWGDDSSWKLQLLDLTRAPEGIVNPIDIGYIELAPVPLRECLEFLDYLDEGVYGARISTLTHQNLRGPLQQLGITVQTVETEDDDD